MIFRRRNARAGRCYGPSFTLRTRQHRRFQIITDITGDIIRNTNAVDMSASWLSSARKSAPLAVASDWVQHTHTPPGTMIHRPLREFRVTVTVMHAPRRSSSARRNQIQRFRFFCDLRTISHFQRLFVQKSTVSVALTRVTLCAPTLWVSWALNVTYKSRVRCVFFVCSAEKPENFQNFPKIAE